MTLKQFKQSVKDAIYYGNTAAIASVETLKKWNELNYSLIVKEYNKSDKPKDPVDFLSWYVDYINNYPSLNK